MQVCTPTEKRRIPLQASSNSHGIADKKIVTTSSQPRPLPFPVLTSGSTDWNSFADKLEAESESNKVASGEGCIGRLRRKRKVLSESQAAAIFLAGIHATDGGAYQRGVTTALAREYKVPITLLQHVCSMRTVQKFGSEP